MDSAAPQCKSVFVWRYEQTGDFGRPKVHRNCIWCDTTLLWDNYWIGDKSDVYDAFCPLCGWFGTRTVKDWSDYEHHAPDEVVSFGYAWQNCLKEFDLSSDELQLEELASHLARNYSDIYSLNPRRFEKLVTNIFSSNGYETLLTRSTRDDGVDIFLLKNGGRYGLVECKRYDSSRKIGVKHLRELVGACVYWDVKRAVLVTTSDYTVPAHQRRAHYLNRGYDIDLIMASDLLDELEVHNLRLPRLEQLTTSAKEEIIMSNHSYFDSNRGTIKPEALAYWSKRFKA
jgi:restriction system protein